MTVKTILILVCINVTFSVSHHPKSKIPSFTGKIISKNVCQTPKDYDTIENNENCWYNPDIDFTPPYLIKKNGYPVEIHPVETKDGFYLEMYRIPHGKNNQTKDIPSKQPVLLQHGIICSSATWVIVGNRSLPFILADKGYDVWLPNSRGSTYTRGHKLYTTSSKKYWDWSYEEMSLLDLPAILDLVIARTGRNDIIYIGQSMGTNLPCIYAAENPEEAKKKLALVIHLAPTIFLSNVRSRFKFLANYHKPIRDLTETFGLYEFWPQTTQFRRFWEHMCLGSSKQYLFCVRILFSTFGPSYDQWMPETLSLLLGHWPAGTSIKNFLHMSQNIQTGTFARFDYGKNENMQIYNSTRPPEYNLSKIEIPTYVMYSGNDFVSPEDGAIRFYESLPAKARVGLQKVKNKRFNHMDFIFGKDVVTEIYEVLLKVIENFNT